MLRRPARPLVIGVGLVGVTGALTGCTAAATDHHYADGMYTAVGSYSSPAGLQGIHVAVQLEDDVVSWIMVTPRTHVGEPAEFQSKFAGAVGEIVLGHDIDQISVSRVAGSSLTSQAFNQALDQIKGAAAED